MEARMLAADVTEDVLAAGKDQFAQSVRAKEGTAVARREDEVRRAVARDVCAEAITEISRFPLVPREGPVVNIDLPPAAAAMAARACLAGEPTVVAWKNLLHVALIRPSQSQ